MVSLGRWYKRYRCPKSVIAYFVIAFGLVGLYARPLVLKAIRERQAGASAAEDRAPVPVIEVDQTPDQATTKRPYKSLYKNTQPPPDSPHNKAFIEYCKKVKGAGIRKPAPDARIKGEHPVAEHDPVPTGDWSPPIETKVKRAARDKPQDKDQLVKIGAKVAQAAKSVKPAAPKSPQQPRNSAGRTGTPYPDFLIIGASKGGTMALVRFMMLHKGVAAIAKDADMLNTGKEGPRALNVNDLIKAIPEVKLRGPKILAKNPTYLIRPVVKSPILKKNPNIKFIVILRNPIDRAISEYDSMAIAAKGKPRTTAFEHLAVSGKLLNASFPPIRHSMYSRPVGNWMNGVSKDAFYFLDGDSFIENPFKELQLLESFMGLKSDFKSEWFYRNQTTGFYCYTSAAKKNFCITDARGRHHSALKLSPTFRTKLQALFKTSNERLFDLIGKNFNW